MEFDTSNNFASLLEQLPYAYGGPKASATMRHLAADFEVKESLSFEPSGQGEHLFIYLKKQGCNSQWVADQLQRHFKLRSQDIGYAGKKDRHSVSYQWFSLHLPGKHIDFDEQKLASLSHDEFKILNWTRHNKKLRKGVIKNNHFRILLRDLDGDIDTCVADKIQREGFANYFGYQRFGRNGLNLNKARALFSGKIRVRSRTQRGLYYSAARSWLFNLQLAARINQQSWNSPLAGDCLVLNHSKSYFSCESIENEIMERHNNGDIHISGWMAGRQSSEASGEALLIESNAIEPYSPWVNALANAKVDSARRAMRVIPQNFVVSKKQNDQVVVKFSLPSGCFATSLLRELVHINDVKCQPREVSLAEQEESGQQNGSLLTEPLK